MRDGSRVGCPVHEDWEERAAIREYCGKQDKRAAEEAAYQEVLHVHDTDLGRGCRCRACGGGSGCEERAREATHSHVARNDGGTPARAVRGGSP